MVLSQRQGLYVAPKIQGVYHITATSTANRQKRAVATVTVLAYCDLPGALVRPLVAATGLPLTHTKVQNGNAQDQTTFRLHRQPGP
jgi:hypothetical protein